MLKIKGVQAAVRIFIKLQLLKYAIFSYSDTPFPPSFEDPTEFFCIGNKNDLINHPTIFIESIVPYSMRPGTNRL